MSYDTPFGPKSSDLGITKKAKQLLTNYLAFLCAPDRTRTYMSRDTRS